MPRQGLYIISVAAQILQMHPQTLRKYERAGFIVPPRMGVLRLYSEEDIARLRLIKYLTEELGLNLAGVELALDLTAKLLDLRSQLRSGENGDAARNRGIEVIDQMLNDLGIEVDDEPRPGGRGSPDGESAPSGRRQARGAPVRVRPVPASALHQ